MTEATIVVGAETTAPPGAGPEGARSLASDAWRSLKKNPIFWVSTALIVLFVLMAIWPSLFTNVDPNAAVLKEARARPSSSAWFGRDIQGYDIYSRTIYGARASILVGVFTSVATVIIGGVMGVLAGYYGGWIDSLVSRVTDIFFAIPLLLGGILFMATFPNDVNSPYLLVVGKVVLVLAIFGWPSLARLMRSSVLQVKPNDYVQAARALGASPWRIIRAHVLPNAVAPMIVVATINLGVFIAVEATLSFLGIGLTPPAVSWGVAISDAIVALRTTPHILLFPSLFLSLTVLAFIMLGDAVRDAFDPKSR
ncbi:ABC transporter permease [Pedococcus sp. 5OH_020]|uniref:ABC transporter permease n=1 Tax=Pedococcus sp. 5OH_020 TaxID=2989814 RepID=UPI0022E9FF29|nr:ABC transporter permease [Pedococcus sp. 5OH_020]